MNILVTGGAGYIGSHTVKALKRAGHSVIVFDSLEHGYQASVPGFTLGSDLIQGDILNKDDLTPVFKAQKFDAVIHFAAFIEVGESVKEPGKFFRNNTAGALHLLEVMADHNVEEIVFSSTAAVYGNPTQVPVKEDDAKKTTNPYGTSKLLVEYILDDLTRYTPLKATILRYFNACGADPEGELGEWHQPETHLIPLVLQVASGQREAIKIFGSDYPTPDGTAVRDYVHVHDLANAHVMALGSQTHAEDKFRYYNVGTGHGYSVKEVIDVCRKITGKTITAENSPRREGDPATLVADATKIQEELGWEPLYSDLETIVTTAWDWLEQHPQGYSVKAQ